MASQLLSEHSAPLVYKRKAALDSRDDISPSWKEHGAVVATPIGLAATAIVAFAVAYIVRWLHVADFVYPSTFGIVPPLSLLGIFIVAIAYYSARYWLLQAQTRAIESAVVLTTNMRDLDSAASAGIALVQEVELVSRGYSM